jgi:hypothetical protein
MISTSPNDRGPVPWASGVIVVAACWLITSPFALRIEGAFVAVNTAGGLLAIVLASSRAAGATDQPWASLGCAAIGVVVAVAPWIIFLGHPHIPAALNNMVIGLGIAGLGYWEATHSGNESTPHAGFHM